MIALLLGILSVVSGAAKQAWTFVKARALLLWSFLAIFLPKAYQFLREWRLLGIGCLTAFAYVVYTVIHDTIMTIVVAVDLTMGISQLINETGWATWLVWTGPLQFSVLWQQLVSCLSFEVSLRIISFGYTKMMWWQKSMSGFLGPRR